MNSLFLYIIHFMNPLFLRSALSSRNDLLTAPFFVYEQGNKGGWAGTSYDR